MKERPSQILIKYDIREDTGELFRESYGTTSSIFKVKLSNERYHITIALDDPFYILTSVSSYCLTNEPDCIGGHENNFYTVENSNLIHLFEAALNPLDRISYSELKKIHFFIYTIDECFDIITDKLPKIKIFRK
ncbi:hypothetical protein [Prevotella sp.]|uniref:hypothetical protein n=1 Tax=Prevotella sp. TaxID=59823 RepID=UPI002F930963